MRRTVRNVLHLIGRDRRNRFVAVGLLSIVVSGLEAVAALLVLVILRFILEPGVAPELPVVGDVSRLWPAASYEELVIWSSVIFAAFFTIRGVLFLFQQYALARVAENTGVQLADRLMDGYLSMPYEFHLRRNSSELIRNAYDNVQQIVGGVFTPMATLIAELTMTGAMILVLLIASVEATAIAVVVMGAVVAATMFVIQPRLKARGRQRQDASRAALQHLQQGLGGLRDIKVLGKERVFSREFRRVRGEMAEAEYHRSVLAYAPRVSMETTFLLLVLAALAVAVSRDEVAGILSTLGVFAYAGLRLQPSLQKIANAFNSLRFADAAVNDLARDLGEFDANQSGQQPDDGRTLVLEHRLELRDVHFRYAGADTDALRGIELTIHRGESIGIAGATGGGKTTLVDVVCGLLAPTTGAVLVDGVDIGSCVRAWQRSLGVVHQTSFLIDDTVRRNVALGIPEAQIDEVRVRKCLEVAQLTSVVAALPNGIDTHVGERGVRLSGGQRQRITLARALYRRPSVLVLDEGTAALDNLTEQAIVEGITSLDDDVTLIMVAHRLTTIQRCDRVIYLEAGRIAAIGRFEELVARNEGFRRLTAAIAAT